MDEGGEDDETELEGVESLPGGRGFMLRMVIPSDFYKYIIGRQGGTKSSIEKDTKTRIRVPQRGTEGDIGERIPNNSSLNAMIITCHTFANFVVQLLKVRLFHGYLTLRGGWI